MRLFILTILFMVACNKSHSEFDLLHKNNPDGFYGEKIYLTDFKSINELINNPEVYLNTDVLVSGEILEVCPMRGCWINVKDPKSDSGIRVKVTDGEIVFPLSSKGKYVDVEGKFSKLEFSEEQAKQWKIHLAQEKGITLEVEDVVINPPDLIEYRIIGKSAKIYSFGCNN